MITNLLGGTFDLTVTRPGLQALRTEGPRPRRDRASGAADDRARSRRAVRGRVGRGRIAQGADEERRAVGDDHGGQIEDIGLRGRDFMGTPEDAAGRRRHVGARRSRLGLGRRHDDQRPDVVQLLVRRRHQQGHRLELRQLRGAGARLDRRSQGAGLELPGRVRPHLRRDDRRRHQERHARLPAAPRRTSSATRTSTPNTLGSPSQLRRRRRPPADLARAARRRRTATTTPPTRSAVRC